MTDFNDFEIDENDFEEMVKEMSLMSGFELGALNTVMPITTKKLFPKYNEMPLWNSFIESNPETDKVNQYGFIDFPEPMPKNKYTQ